jgi:hypothetical protein
VNLYRVIVSGWTSLGSRGVTARGSSFRCEAVSPSVAARIATERFFLLYPAFDEVCLRVQGLDFEASIVGHRIHVWTHRGEA